MGTVIQVILLITAVVELITALLSLIPKVHRKRRKKV